MVGDVEDDEMVCVGGFKCMCGVCWDECGVVCVDVVVVVVDVYFEDVVCGYYDLYEVV